MYVPAWILILVALFVVWLLVKQRPPRLAPFEPFRVTIRPEWRALLDDHLDMTPERWQAVEQWIAVHPEQSRVWRDGVTFTVLRAGADGSLNYLDHQHAFQSALDWSEPVPGLFWRSEIAAQFGEEGIQPWLVVREGADGYELAIVALGRDMFHASRRGDVEELHESVDDSRLQLVVARLPLAAIRSADTLPHQYARVTFRHI